jgi:1-aminocyclopropane-1-carboxylate deaminase/D-cysteine desulfhydrase-like pyridoxal-dependent ACC family enzyme
LFIKRDDLIHPEISGNKWRKLKWNVENARSSGYDCLLTFGGAHSNHIAATAATANLFGMRSIGIIRGEEVDLQNPTLHGASLNGMEIHRISRSAYAEIRERSFLEELRHRFGPVYIIPEGGRNHYGVQGCSEIMSELERKYDRIFLACGTATTLSGMAIANEEGTQLFGVSALKGGSFLRKTVQDFVEKAFRDKETENSVLERVSLLTDYHFGGYAKCDKRLIQFMRNFHRKTNVKLDPIYTAKAAFAMYEQVKQSKIRKAENWLFIHSGGLQGIPAFEAREGYDIYPDC